MLKLSNKIKCVEMIFLRLKLHEVGYEMLH